MIAWLGANIGTILVVLMVAAVMALAIRSIRRDKKKGASCGCGCSGCAMSGTCHAAQKPKKPE